VDISFSLFRIKERGVDLDPALDLCKKLSKTREPNSFKVRNWLFRIFKKGERASGVVLGPGQCGP
jgi:hypothetical protein